MTTALDHWKDQLGALPESERLDLVLYLLQTLDPEDAGASDAWQAEVARRAEEVRGGRAKGRLAEDVFRTMRERYP